MTIRKLTEDERALHLPKLVGWLVDPERDGIRKTFRFADFIEAFGFMTRVALLAERADHHPDFSNFYKRVEILLTTLDAAGLSLRDVALAREIDELGAAAA